LEPTDHTMADPADEDRYGSKRKIFNPLNLTIDASTWRNRADPSVFFATSCLLLGFDCSP
jgi:hypothetical protein